MAKVSRILDLVQEDCIRARAWYTKTVVALASCIVAFILYLGAVDINFLWLFGKSPGYFSGILDPQTSEAS